MNEKETSLKKKKRMFHSLFISTLANSLILDNFDFVL